MFYFFIMHLTKEGYQYGLNILKIYRADTHTHTRVYKIHRLQRNRRDRDMKPDIDREAVNHYWVSKQTLCVCVCVCWQFHLVFLLHQCDSTDRLLLFTWLTEHSVCVCAHDSDCVYLTCLLYPWPSSVPCVSCVCENVCAVCAACGLHAVLFADQGVCVCVCVGRLPLVSQHLTTRQR